jgi:hypothetical protein
LILWPYFNFSMTSLRDFLFASLGIIGYSRVVYFNTFLISLLAA